MPEVEPESSVPAGFHSQGQIYMLILAVLVSAFVAIFVLRKIWRIWSRGKQSENRNEEALLQQTTGGNNTNVVKNS